MSPVEIKGWGMGWSLTTGQFDSNTAETLHHILSSIFSYDRYNGQEYDISWTMPQCVLCLRLIGLFNCFFFVVFMELCSGLAWDVYDGERQRLRPISLSPDQVCFL